MLDRIIQINVGFLFTLFVGFWIGFTSSANAFIQNDRTADAVNFNDNEAIEANDVESNENGTNSFRLEHMSRKEALKTIADKADLTLTYCSGVFQKSATVSVRGSEMNFEGAIREILNGSDVGFKITDSRHLVVFKKEKASVAGEVVDKSTGSPLQGARVMLVDEDKDSAEDASIKRATFVDPEGQYDFKDVKPGTYKLIIAYFGYNKAFEHIHVDRGTTVGNFKIVEKKK